MAEFLSFLSCVSFVTFSLVIWFKTEVIVEYFGLYKDEYVKWKKENIELASYPEFLATTKHCFFTRLLNCPFCLGFWLSLLVAHFSHFPISFFLTFYVFGLILYLMIERLND